TGTTAPEGIDGVSFAPTLLGQPRQKEHDYLYWEFGGYGGQQAVRMGPWKAVRQNVLRKNNPRPLAIELYHLGDDLGEQDDVAAEHADVVAKMRSIMNEGRTPSEIFPMKPLDAP
ncbi:MAG: arylsulfatase, partial [Planctomycetes bacterium]|nr:arylsulfatase [Planctomycetota bacterium]